MGEFIVDTIARGGYLGIFALMVLENVFPPVPSEVIMGIGGILVARGEMQFWPLLVIGTLGTTAGNYFWYWLGDRFGYRRLEPFVQRWGRWLTLEWEDVERAILFFHKYGDWVIFLLRFSPFLRTIISLPAGLAHMQIGRFLFFTFTGSLIWNAALIMGGQWLSRWLERSQDVLGWGIISLTALALGAYLWRVVTWKPRADR
ncbi:DedA family protein [Erythrobacter sp. SDW2]|uniref:DedA family protein n=1 Tax=Erythrobacter sp. SDW2 TaxID=2907154 RepID=UPI001F2281AB|nr:DedA family protein [Erythrobacter sp. SDW2]UIP05800.1 DedA family protein [Erythrobacter sp. SDW2]